MLVETVRYRKMLLVAFWLFLWKNRLAWFLHLDSSVYFWWTIFEWRNCHRTPDSSKGKLYNDKNEGKNGWLFQCLLFLPDITSLRRVALRGDATARRGHVSGEGSRAAEKVDQYQAKRSAPTNLCGDPSNDTSRSLQPNRFREYNVENRDMLLRLSANFLKTVIRLVFPLY